MTGIPPGSIVFSHPLLTVLASTGQVVDALVEHFVAFADDERRMPVVWHQSLLCFVQRYKHEIKEGDKARLRALCSEQHHYQVRALAWGSREGAAAACYFQACMCVAYVAAQRRPSLLCCWSCWS